MRSRRSGNDQIAEVARRRLELLSAELADLRRDPDGPVPSGRSPVPRHETQSLVHSDDPERESVRLSGQPGSDSGPVVARRPDVSPGRHAHRSVGVSGLAAGWLQDRLPASLQGRVRMSAAHVVVVALVALLGVAVTGWWVWRSDNGGSAVPLTPSAASVPGAPDGADASGGAVAPLVTPAGTPAVSGAGTSAAPPTAEGVAGGSVPPSAAAASPGPVLPGAVGVGQSGSGAGSIVVDVTGKVRRPGIATLPVGSRVVDALEAAGGPRPGARLGALNLARVLVDGEQVVVGVPPPPGLAATAASAPTPAAPGPLVNLNTASQSELEELPGVGPVTALSILEFRARNGAFTSVDELLEVSGIGDATLAELAPFVTL
ncbi:MAG TPA: helix-hairpin-helix domain-containing protein [Nocardioidaceae bacterium]|nr:helix-hairpin-helix domain-containing protein [Nocardioidaceae bacterium]